MGYVRSCLAMVALALLCSACQTRDAVPVVDVIAPPDAKPGDTITLTGRNFGAKRDTGWVEVSARPFNDFPTILSWSDSEIVAVLDEDLVGPAQLSVVTGGKHSRPVTLALEITCSTPPEYERKVDLAGSTASRAYDVVRSTQCRAAIVGAATTDEDRQAGFFVLTDDFGETAVGPVYYEKTTDLRSITRTPAGYLLVGSGAEGDVVILRVDEDGELLAGWPRFVGAQSPIREVRAAAVASSQIAVTGLVGENSFLYQIDLEGTLQHKRELTDQDFGAKRALGVEVVPGGFVVLGDRQKLLANPPGQKITTSWIARANSNGQGFVEYDNTNGETLIAASALDDDTFAAVGTATSGRTAYFTHPDLDQQFGFDTMPDVEALADVEPIRNGFVAAGTGRTDASLVRLDCAGGPQALERVDLGAEEGFEAVVPVYPGLPIGNETGYLAVGATVDHGTSSAIVAWRERFDVPTPQVSFTANGHTSIEVGLGESVELGYQVAGAWNYELRKVSGPGPDPTGGLVQLANEPATGSQTLTFDTPSLNACAAGGCAASIYELVASTYPEGRCRNGTPEVARVTINFALDEKWVQLVTSSALIVQKYGSFEQSTALMGPAHPNADAFGKNRCLNGLGIPYGTEHAIGGLLDTAAPGDEAVIDDREPQLVLYDADALGDPGPLRGYALGSRFVTARPTIQGDDWVEPDKWWGHWGGWHTGEGGMTLVVPGQPGGDWMEPPMAPPPDCGSRNAFCGAKFPWIRHPALWDVHVFFPPSGALPQVVFTTGCSEDLDNPCADINPELAPAGLTGCDTGVPSLNLNPFYRVDASDQPLPISCSAPVPCDP